MRNKDAFSGYYPTINFLYFALVLLFSMCLMHPVYLAISLTGALAYDIYLKGRKAARFAVMGLLPMAVFAALVNPAFNHEGATILTYLPSGNPLTLESMLYGAAAAVMLASVVLWFSSYNEVMTSDKFVYLFGRVIPALSLVLSMSLRFIPKFKAQMQTVSEAQACIGRDTKNGSVLRRVGNAVRIFSILVTWSLENAIETADSMRSRGYGLPGRTAFSIHRFDDRDKAALAWLIFCGAYLISGWMAGGTYFRYYPTAKTAAWTPMTVSFMLVYLALVLTPRDSRPKGGQAVEVFTIRNLTFAYPEQEKHALSDLTLSVQPGEFLVPCGPSGCGKSTLLRQLKTVLAPHGRRSGEILFDGKNLDELPQREQAEKIGFVQQSPENQIVTDKVWHELAFGLESLGYDTLTIRRRVAEMASFFGIQTWFYKSVTELSGGQKQLLNLASVMVLQPKVLILDEPTSQLDPIAASDFLATLGKINRELGTTILLTEHRLEEAFSFASRVAVMDKGTLLCTGTPADVGAELKASGNTMFLAMPAAMRIWAATDSKAPCPISVCDGRNWLLDYAKSHELQSVPEEAKNAPDTETVVSAREVWFKNEKDLPDVVKGLSLDLHKGEFLALLGGNGTGKTTTLKLLASLKKAYRGELTITGSVGMLPQNPQALFVKATVREDLLEILPKSERKTERLAQAVSLCKLADLLDRHPYDLSGGEQQRLALGKLLLLKPKLLLLDEPTKGLDPFFKQTLAALFKRLTGEGVTILMVSHDLEFCARHADRCALMFDGEIVSVGTPRQVLAGNRFYTTSAGRLASAWLPEAILWEEVAAGCAEASTSRS